MAGSSLVIPADLPAEIAGLVAGVHQDLLNAAEASDDEKKVILRELQRRWHPDKNVEEDKAAATAVFQYIGASRDWFLTNKRSSNEQ